MNGTFRSEETEAELLKGKLQTPGTCRLGCQEAESSWDWEKSLKQGYPSLFSKVETSSIFHIQPENKLLPRVAPVPAPGQHGTSAATVTAAVPGPRG